MFVKRKTFLFFSSDGGEGGSGGSSSDGDSGDETIETLKAKLADAERVKAEAIEGRQTTKQALKDAKAEAERLKGELEGLNRKKIEESGDLDKIRGEYQKEVDKEKDRAAAAENALKTERIQNSFRAAAGGLILPEYVDDVFILLRDKFDISKDSGQVHVPGSTKSVKDFVREYLESKPAYAVNPAVGGGGVNGGANRGETGTGMTEKRFKEMTPAQQQKWARENPNEWKKYTSRSS